MLPEQPRAECTLRESEVTVKEVGQPLWSLKFIEPVIIMGLIMERVTINPPVSRDGVIVLQSPSSSRPATATMTSCCGRRKACSGDRAGRFLGRFASLARGSRIQQRSAELQAAH